MLPRINNICALAVCTALATLATPLTVAAAEYEYEYEHKTVNLSSIAGEERFVCRVKHNGEFLIDLPSFCYRLSVVDVSQNYLLLAIDCCEFPEFDGDEVVYAYDKISGTVTDSLSALSYLYTILDRGTPVVITTWDNDFHVYQEFSHNYMHKAHALENGRFVEIESADYINLRELAEETVDSIVAISLTNYGPDCYESSDPSSRISTAGCARLYEAASAQLREIFSLADAKSDAEDVEWGCRACRLFRAGRWTWLSQREGQEYYCMPRHCNGHQWPRSWGWGGDYLLRELRKYTHALYEKTGLTGLYKQGRYHVMENGVLLWSSTKRPADGQFGIVLAPGGYALFILSRSDVQPVPGDTVVWTYNRKKQTITNIRLMTVISDIKYDTETVAVTELHGADGFDQPLPWPKLHIFRNGRWVEDEVKNYPDTADIDVIKGPISRFIARIHLECRGDMDNCRHSDDYKRALKLYKKALTYRRTARQGDNLFKDKAQSIYSPPYWP